MSLKDDFLEALRSVKRDFLKDYETAEPAPAPKAAEESFSPIWENIPARSITDNPRSVSESSRDAVGGEPREPLRESEAAPAKGEAQSEDIHIPAPSLELVEHDDEESIAPDVDPAPFRTFDSETDGDTGADAPKFDSAYIPSGGAFNVPPGGGDSRVIFDAFDSGDNDERTVISRNTVIRGALQTEDSVRMFGQIMGDIDCKSNILVAGKVRGNTSAANAYVINAQVDGNLLCDDVINITDDAWILGNIRAQQADIDGKIKGNIEIRHTTSIGSNSSIIGNISTDELEIKRGAFVNGQVMMYSPSRDVIDRFDRFGQ